MPKSFNEMDLTDVYNKCVMNNSDQPGSLLFEKCIKDALLSMADKSKDSFSIVIQFMFAISICIGIVGNTLVIVSVLVFHFMRNFANIFLLNLAISDMLVMTIAAPTTLVNHIHTPFQFSPFFCRLQSCLQSITVHVSVLSLMSISFERFYVVMFPLRYKVIFKTTKIKIWLISIWVLSIILSIPLGLASELIEIDSSNNTIQCKETWFGDQLYKKIYTISSFVILYLIPLFFMFILHFILIMKLWKMPSEITSSIRNEEYSNRRRKLSIILIMLCLIFLICWLPHHVRCIYNDIHHDHPHRNITEFMTAILTPISYIMCYLNSSINPYCSLIISTKFRYCVKCIFQFLYSTTKHRGFPRNQTLTNTRKQSSQYLARARSLNLNT